MTRKDLHEKLNIPHGITVTTEGSLLQFKGPKGIVRKKFDSPAVKVTVKDSEIDLSSLMATKKQKAVMNSYWVHIRNALQGVKTPYSYKLKICSGHFPMNVSVADNHLVVKNYLGEKVPRKVKIKQGVTVKIDAALIIVESSDKDLAGQVAADIEMATKRAGFDRRIFQDGIYIIERPERSELNG